MPFLRGSRMCPGIKSVSLQSLPVCEAYRFPTIASRPTPRLHHLLAGHNGWLIGYSLAYTELYLTLGHLFRRFEMTVHGTSEADMEWTDCGIAQTMGELKVKLREAKEWAGDSIHSSVVSEFNSYMRPSVYMRFNDLSNGMPWSEFQCSWLRPVTAKSDD